MSNEEQLIESLKQENENLKKQLEALKTDALIAKYLSSSTSSIEQYYTHKYLSFFDEISNYRINDIIDKQKKLAIEVEEIGDKISSYDIIKKNNSIYQKQIEDNQKLIEELEQKRDAQITVLNDLLKAYKNSQYVLKNSTIGYYDTIYKSMNPLTDANLVLANCSFVIEMLKEQLYPLIIECVKISFKVSSQEKIVDELNIDIEQNKQAFASEANKLKKLICKETLEELKDKFDSTSKELQLNKELKEEMEKTFLMRKEADLKNIVDKIAYYKVIDTKPSEIAGIMENYLDDLKNSLSSQQTYKKIRSIKELELLKLTKEKESLDALKKATMRKKERLVELQSIYKNASISIDKLVDYVDSATLAISENAEFKLIYEKYQNLTHDESILEANYKEKANKVVELEKLKQDKEHIACPQSELKELLLELTNATKEKNRYADKLRACRDELSSIKNASANLKLMSVIRERDYASNLLPSLYQDLKRVKAKQTALEQEFAENNEVLNDYDKLVYSIENLKNELKDC